MTLLRTIASVLACTLATSLAATGASADATRGKALVQQGCASCHAVEPGQQSPNPKAPTFSAIAGEPSTTAYGLHVFLQTTHATMPNFVINPDDIDDIVSYILSLKAKP
jgi:cytochrome c